MSGYLERLLEGFGEAERSELFRALLVLIDLESDQRIAAGRSVDALEEHVEPLQRRRFERGLEYLASPKARVLEAFEVDGKMYYRLTHERLIPAVRQLTGVLLAEAEQARLELDRCFQIYSDDGARKFLLSGRVLRDVLRHEEELRLEKEPEKRELVARSRRWRAVRRGMAVGVVAVLVAVGAYVAMAWEADGHRNRLRAWGLPGNLYDVQGQLEELSIQESISSFKRIPIHRLDWLNGPENFRMGEALLASLEGLPTSLHSLELNLSKSPVTSVGELPTDLQLLRLNLYNSRVTGLDHLPPNLQSLELSLRGSQITSLESLPSALQSLHLELSGDQITILDSLPSALQSLNLDLSAHTITSLGRLPPNLQSLQLTLGSLLVRLEGFPSALQSLWLKLDASPVTGLDHLPPGLESLGLVLSNSRITRLDHLPSNLQSLELRLRDCPITSLESLPTALRSLHLDLSFNNQITSLTGLPPDLLSLELDLSYSQVKSLAGLPSSLTHLELTLSKHFESLDDAPHITKSLDLSKTKIKSLEGLPEGLEELTLRAWQVDSLEGLPTSVKVLRFVYD